MKKLLSMLLCVAMVAVMFVGCSAPAAEPAPADDAANNEAAAPAIAEEYTVDVAVVGAGGAGLFAAYEASKAGATVLVLEKTNSVSNSNSNQIGGTCGVESRMTKSIGETYTAEQLYNRLLDYAHYTVNPTLLRECVYLMGSTCDLFEDMGVVFAPGADRFHTGFVNVHQFQTGNKMALVAAEAEALGAQILYETPGTELIMKDGACVGVIGTKADGSQVKVNAKAVLLSTGGFLGNDEMMHEIFGDINVHVMIGETACTGDGINMAMAVGAQKGKTFALSLNDLGGTNSKASCMDNFGVYMMDRNQAMTFGVGCGLFVNSQGERFFNEFKLANEPLAAGGEALLHAGPNGYYYTIVNQALVDDCVEMGYYKAIGSPVEWTDAVENTDNPVIMHNIALPRLQADLEQGIEEGWVWKADTIEELAQTLGMESLVETVANYDAMCAAGKDEQFFKPASMMKEIGEGPYYMVEYHTGSWCTMGGIVTDENLVAVNEAHEPIPGLYIAGGDNSSIYAAPYYDVGGTSSGLAFNSGRLAGMKMAEYALSK